MERLSQLRYNPATGRWVICAPARGARPHDLVPPRQPPAHPSRSACPFCPGHESMLPGILVERPGPPGTPWQTRVVPNKFPALSPLGARARRAAGSQLVGAEPAGPYLTLPGHGRHEVVVETPHHDRDLAVMTPKEVEAVIETYHDRYRQLAAEEGVAAVVIFRNHGRGAGTSLAHPHSQIIACPLTPPALQWRQEQARRYFEREGRCAVCDLAAFEQREGQRLVGRRGSLVAFVPFAAEVPFEVWLVPGRHRADFGGIRDEERRDLASLLQAVLATLSSRLGDPDYNLIIHTAPPSMADAPHLHWFVQIRPRLTTPAGFEVATGIRINPSVPEDDARRLRGGEG